MLNKAILTSLAIGIIILAIIVGGVVYWRCNNISNIADLKLPIEEKKKIKEVENKPLGRSLQEAIIDSFSDECGGCDKLGDWGKLTDIEYDIKKVDLNSNDNDEVIVKGNKCICEFDSYTIGGVTENQSFRILGQQNDEWVEIGSMHGESYSIEETKTKGFYDIITDSDIGGAGCLRLIETYKWDGSYYNQVGDETKDKCFKCGDVVTFIYKGSVVTYGTVESQDRCWLDRNLGASQVAIVHDDPLAYGDLFQWGRGDDGHQDRESDVTSILSNSDNPGHSNFILVDSKPYNWRDSQNDNLWQGVLGINNPCPSGWRIPTEAEWDFERANWSEQNAGGAFMSPLKLTLTGYRTFSSDSPYQSPQSVSTDGSYWSSTVSDVYASSLHFNLTAAFFSDVSNSYVAFLGDAWIGKSYRASGYAVRCIKN